MRTTLLLLLSGAMIAAGVGLIWRDVRKRRRESFVVPRDLESGAGDDADVEITAVPRQRAAPTDSGGTAVPFPGGAGSADAAAHWAALQPVIGEAVQQVNAVLAAAGVSVGAPGEPSWSMSRGYGTYRRILIGGESLAWLRLELDPAGQLHAGVKAHKDDLAAINANSSVPAEGLITARASDLLSECLKPAASLAVQAAGGGDTERWASGTAWAAIDPIVTAALQAANGALAQAGARFVAFAPAAWAPDVGRHRLMIGIQVFDRDVARLLVERIGEEVEIAVGLADAHLASLGRRQRIPLQGLTTHGLAELIASCAWPAIAHFREVQPSA
jgi:hypothetical protein